MAAFIDLTGKRFGRLTVISRVVNCKRTTFLCRCDCGKMKNALSGILISGEVKSCGCLNIEALKNRAIHGHGRRGEKTKEYMAWVNMITRCYYKKYSEYESYGGRGIIVCERWRKSFVNFLADMGLAPSKEHSLDRKNNNGNYELSNCRWATPGQQGGNTSRNRWIEHDGIKMIASDWIKHIGISNGWFYKQLKKKSFADIYATHRKKKNC